MVRFILLAAFIGVIAFAIVMLLGTIRIIARTEAKTGLGKDNDIMPARFQRITYILLVLLMLGVTTGVLEGL